MRISACVLALAMLTAASAAAPWFTDSFDAAADPQWGNEVGNWTVVSGRYDATSPNNVPPTISSLPFILTDFIVDVDVVKIHDGGIWLRTELDGGSGQARNGVLLVTGGYGGGNSGLYWHTFTNGGYSSPLNHSATGLFTPGVSDVHLQVRVEGDTYQAFLDGSPTPATTLTTSAYPSGRVGLYDYSTLQSFDNFAISDIPEPACLTLLALGAAALIRRRR